MNEQRSSIVLRDLVQLGVSRKLKTFNMSCDKLLLLIRSKLKPAYSQLDVSTLHTLFMRYTANIHTVSFIDGDA